ncbi:hypothetical protein [Psychroserpens sp.]
MKKNIKYLYIIFLLLLGISCKNKSSKYIPPINKSSSDKPSTNEPPVIRQLDSNQIVFKGSYKYSNGNKQTNGTKHIQGIITDSSFIYWSFTHAIIKTDYKGNVIDSLIDENQKYTNHFADLTLVNDKLIVTSEHWPPAWGKKSKIYSINKNNFKEIEAHPINLGKIEGAVNHGAGTIEHYNNKYYLSGYIKKGTDLIVSELNENFEFLRQINLGVNSPKNGIQTMKIINDEFWISCYGPPGTIDHLFVFDNEWNLKYHNNFSTIYGMAQNDKESFFVVRVKENITYLEKVSF